MEIKALKVADEIGNQYGVNVTKDVKALLQKYNSLFQSGIGKLKDFTAQFSMKENSQPRYTKHRNVPYSQRKKVGEELEWLEKDDILKPVKSSEWASPIVPVVKNNGSVRSCEDFKTTLNPALKHKLYPLPKIADIFTILAERGRNSVKLTLHKLTCK